MSLTKTQLLQADTLTPQKVKTPEWGGEVYVAELSADERDQLETDWRQAKDTADDEGRPLGFRGWVVAFCLCDAAGQRLFDDAGMPAAAASIGAKHSKPVCRVFNKAAAINGLLKEDVEALEKNSEATPNADGSGGSH